MSLQLVKHRKAKRDALLAFVYIGENNMDAAERFLRALDEDFKRIAATPGLGARREFANPQLAGIRSLPVSGFQNYLIFYRVTASQVQILRVIHGARDIERALDE